METVELQVEARSATGKGACRRLRAQGRLPAVVYGHSLSAQPISCDREGFITAMQGEMSRNTCFRLAGPGDLDGRLVLAREVQRTAVMREIVHVDLYVVEPDREVLVQVPVRPLGTPVGVKTGGQLRQLRRDIEVLCLPASIPAFIGVDVSALEVGDSLSITDIEPEGDVRTHYRHEYAICRVLVPRGLEDEEEEEEEGEEEMEAEEGEEEAAPE